MIHHQDIGGLLPGSASVYAHDLYSEGLRIKLTKIVEAGDLNIDLLGLMKSNSRTPETLQGDLLAQIAAGTMGATRMTALASEYGIKSFNHGVEALSLIHI